MSGTRERTLTRQKVQKKMGRRGGGGGVRNGSLWPVPFFLVSYPFVSSDLRVWIRLCYPQSFFTGIETFFKSEET